VYGQDQGQYYDESYSNDNLYHDYAARQQDKVAGNPATPWGKIVAGTVVGWLAGGRFHSKKSSKKLSEKHKQETKQLYAKYYNDVYALKEQEQQLISKLEQMGVQVNY